MGRNTLIFPALLYLLYPLTAEEANNLPAMKEPTGTVVHESRFDQPELPGWSTAPDKSLPRGKSTDGQVAFLGECHNDPVQLALKNLPKHEFLIVEADLLILKTWGGSEREGDKDGPDVVTIRLVDGPVLLCASFSSFAEMPQSFPDAFPAARHAGLTGATRTGLPSWPAFSDPSIGTTSAYRLRMVVRNSAENVTISFQAALTENLPENLTTGNESWALANVRVSVTDQPPAKVDAQRFAQLWSALNDSGPVAANAAVWDLISAGESVLPMIKSHMDKSSQDVDAQEVSRWIEELNGEEFETRQAASRKLLALGRKVTPHLQRALDAKPPLEIKARLDGILKDLQGSLTTRTAADTRLRKTLELIGGPDAAELLKNLPPAPNYQPLSGRPEKIEDEIEDIGVKIIEE